MNLSLVCVTNRQALILADQIFNRGGQAPAILGAWLVQKDSAKKASELYEKSGKWVNCTGEIMCEWEKQCTANLGNLNLWPREIQSGEKVTLTSLKISDSFPAISKEIWIRFSRAGDGKRGLVKLPVDGFGNVTTQEVTLDMDGDLDNKMMLARTAITKDEFLSCFLSSPLLAEPIRKISCAPLRPDDSRVLPTRGQGIRLDVVIALYDEGTEEGEIMEMMNVQQSILLEVWDQDADADDFLGEAWLP
eukprot:6363702-Amphidinium_carterae.1